MNSLVDQRFVLLGGPLGDGSLVELVLDAPDESTIHSTLAADPWAKDGRLEVVDVHPWTILLAAPDGI
jgi:hypothetical protein